MSGSGPNPSHPLLNEASLTFMEAAGALAPQAIADMQGDELAAGRLLYVRLAKAFEGPLPVIDNVQNFAIRGREGHAIPLRFYQKAHSNPKALTLFVHGGGWSRGNLDTHDALCRHLCINLGAPVLAVDYRLAPEHPYPAGLQDVQDAYTWALGHTDDLGLNNPRLLLVGDSGGGNLACALMISLMNARARTGPHGLGLIYPALDLRLDVPNTEPLYDEGCFLTRARIHDYINNYIGGRPALTGNPLVSPLLAPEPTLAAFPPTVIVSAGSDPLISQAHAFIHKLSALNVPTAHHIAPKAIHIYAQFFGLFKQAHTSLDFMVKQLKPFIE